MPKQRKNDPKDSATSKAFRFLLPQSQDERREWAFSTCRNDRQARDMLFENSRMSYEKTGNPLEVWRAFVLARETRENGQMDVPEWVLEYLDGVAKGLLTRPDKNTLQNCALHLGFDLKDGGHSPFTQETVREIRAWAVAYVITTLQGHPKMRVEDACELTRERLAKEQLNYTWETIRGWYYSDIKKVTT